MDLSKRKQEMFSIWPRRCLSFRPDLFSWPGLLLLCQRPDIIFFTSKGSESFQKKNEEIFGRVNSEGVNFLERRILNLLNIEPNGFSQVTASTYTGWCVTSDRFSFSLRSFQLLCHVKKKPSHSLVLTFNATILVRI